MNIAKTIISYFFFNFIKTWFKIAESNFFLVFWLLFLAINIFEKKLIY